MTLRIIDIESTGLPENGGEVIEIASVDLARDWSISAVTSTLVKPGKPVPPEASAVHHIVDADLVDAPSLAEAVAMFRSGGPDLYLVAHNCVFEKHFLAEHIPAKAWLCTFKSARRLWPDWPSHANQALRYRLGLIEPFGIPRSEITPHRASSDVVVTAAILAQILRTKAASFGQLLEWSEQPLHVPRIPFGKQRGKPWIEADDGLLAWIIRSDMDDDVKDAARAEQGRRVA